jgi:hypothetical protein
MSNQISTQASKFWQLVAAPGTRETYQQTITTTGQILREAALLVWLVLCLVLVFFDWIGTVAVTWGRQLRTWIATVGETRSDQMAADTGKALLTVGKTGIASTIALARNQLGLPEKPAPADPALLTPPTKAPTVLSDSASLINPYSTPRSTLPTATEDE